MSKTQWLSQLLRRYSQMSQATVFHVEWISLHDMSVLIIAFNVTMSFRMMATMATLKGFPLARSFS